MSNAIPPEPPIDRAALRAKLIAARLALPDRHERAVELQSVLRVWLVSRKETAIGGYWPIKGEFDPLPALYRWAESADERRIGLPVHPVIDDINQTGDAAKRHESAQHIGTQFRVAPALTEQQAGKNKNVFEPLMRAHELEKAEQGLHKGDGGDGSMMQGKHN